MNDWAVLYKDEFIEYGKKVNEVQKRIKNLKNSVVKS
jgi:hypothetical protein